MKRCLSPFLLFLFAVSACKKDKAPQPAADAGKDMNVPVQPAQLAITRVSPTSGLPNTLVTITGSGFGTSATDVTIYFNGVKGSVQSVTATEIKVLVPVTTSGPLVVTAGNKSVSTGNFTYIYPELAAAYVGGDVTLLSQADVDKFVELNKGRQLQITGTLRLGATYVSTLQTNDITSVEDLSMITTISGQLFCYKLDVRGAGFFRTLLSAGGIYIGSCRFTTLDFARLQAFTGALTISEMPELTQVRLDVAPVISGVTISACPKLTDLSFLDGINAASTVSIGNTGAMSVTFDKLKTLSSLLSVTGNTKLTSLSCAALTGAATVTITGNTQLNDITFPALTAVSGKLTLTNLGITDLAGFSAVERLGALQVYNNSSLASLNGLEKLSSLTMSGVVTSSIAGTSPLTRVNGIYISNNNRLLSLSGLQNITTIPIAYITNNPLLTDLCPFKRPIAALNTAAAFSYTYRDQLDYTRTATVAALTLTNNGIYATKQDALNAVAECK